MECSWRKGEAQGTAWRHILGEGTAKRNAMLEEDPSKAPPFVASGLRIELNMLDLVGVWMSHGFKSQHPIQLTSTNGQLITNPSIFFPFCPEKNIRKSTINTPPPTNRSNLWPRWWIALQWSQAPSQSLNSVGPSARANCLRRPMTFFRWSEKGLLFKRLTL